MSISFDDLIPKQSKADGLSFDDLIPAAPPQGQVSASPTAAVSSGPTGGEAVGTVSRGFELPPVMDPFGINRPVTPPAATFKAGTPGYSVMGDLPPIRPMPMGVRPEFVDQLSKDLAAMTPAQRDVVLSENSLRGTVAKRLLEQAVTQPVPDNSGRARRRDFAEANPLTGALASGSANVLKSTINIPNVAADLFNQSVVNPIGNALGLGEMPRTGFMPGTESLDQMGRDYMPAVGQQSLAKAIEKGQFKDWFMVNMSAQTPQIAQTVAMAVNPALRPLMLPTMGGQEAAAAYTEGDDSRVAATKGTIAALAEMLPLKAFDSVRDRILALPSGVQRNLLQEASRRLAAAGAALTVQSLVGGIEEVLTEVGKNAVDIGVGKDVPLFQNVPEAGVLGAGGGGVIATPNIAKALTQGDTESPAAQLARALQGEVNNTSIDQDATRRAAVDLLNPSRAQMQRIEPTLNFDDLIPTSANPSGEANGNQVQGIAQAPAVLRNEPTFIDPASIGAIDPAPAPAVAPTAPVAAAAPSEPAPSVAPTQPEPPSALTPPVGNDGQQPATTTMQPADMQVLRDEALKILNTPDWKKSITVEEVMGDEDATYNIVYKGNVIGTTGTLPLGSGSVFDAVRKAQAADKASVQRVSTVTGRQVETRMRVVDASELMAASGDLQPRDRSRATSDEQINAIAGQLDPQRLGTSAEADRGAPIIGPDMIVESGNGRVMAIRRAFEMFPERAQAYREYLASQGYDTTGVKTPVLVRERLTPMTQQERVAFVQEANQSATMALSPVEQAKIDTAAMTDSVVDVWRGGDVSDAANRDFVSAFVGALPQSQRNALLDSSGRLSPDGAVRIRRALLAAAYDDRELLTELIESADDNIRSIGNALFDSAAGWLQMRRMARDNTIDPAFDTTAQLVTAARTVSQLRKQRQNVQDWLSQDDLASPRDPIVDAFVKGFYNEKLTRAIGREAINDVLQTYTRFAKEQDTPSMFGEQPTPLDLAQGAVEQRNDSAKTPEQQGLLDAAPGDVRAGPGVQRRGRQAQDSAVQGRGARVDRQGQQEPLLDTADAGRPAQGAGTQGTGNQAGAGEVNGRAAVPAERDAGAEASDRQDGGRVSAPAKNQRVKGAGKDQFVAASFTNRQSIYRDAFQELGLDPEQAELLPPARQFEILSRGLKDTYGLAFVQKSDPANLRQSIDQLLDAYRGMQLMTHVLDLPTKAIGLDGKMGLALIGKGTGFLGAYFPMGGSGKVLENLQTSGPTIAMPGRSNSFAHEWGHALDYFIADKYQGAVADLSGMVRQGESLSDQMPETVADSFRLLMNSMFFDNAEMSGRIMDLERRIEAAAFKGIDATGLKTQLAQLQSGASKSPKGRSQFYQASGDFALGQGSDPTYWRKPTEMLARSFEAYIAHKVEAAGGSTEFIAKGDFAYQSNADDRLRMTFPKDSDRFNIFRSYDLLFDAIRAEALLGDGPAATMPNNIRLSDPAVYFGDQQRSAQSPAIKAAWEAEKRAFQLRGRQLEKIGNRPNDDRPVGKRLTDGVRSILETNRGVLLSMESHYVKTSGAAATAIREITKRIATDPGSSRETYQDGTFAEAVDRETRRLMTRLSNISSSNDLDLFTDRQLGELSNVLTAMGNEALFASPEVVKAAAPLRELLTDLYYYNANAGLDIGFVENGYLPRLLDEPVVTERAGEFVKDATLVYKIVFERDTERPSNADDIQVALQALAARMKEALISPKNDANLAAYAKARKDMSELVRKLNAANADGDGDKIDSAQAALSEFMAKNMEVFEEAYEYVRDVWSAQAAAEYQTRISYGSPENFSSHSPAGSFLKERTLPPEADKILAKYYIQDPVERITNYVQQSVRKAEYNRRFGIDTRGNEKNTKLYRFLESMVNAGVRKEDRDLVERIVAQVTGTDRSTMPQQAQRLLGAVHAIGTMTLLGRVVLTSLAEPMTVSFQTGRPLDALKAVALTIQEVAATGSVRERRAMAQVLGIVSGDLTDEIISNRLGGTVGESGTMQRASSQFFRRVGLTGLTNAQRRASMQLAGRYVLDMAHALDDEKASANEKGYARDELVDAGLTNDDIDSFVQWAREYDSRMPRHDELIDVDGSLTAMGKVYSIMVGRLVNQAIQNPTAIDRPWAANTVVGRMTFGLLSFSMAFFRNVIIRSGKRVIREYEKRGAGQAAYVASMQLLAPIATLYMGHLLVTMAREAMLNPERWEEEEKKEGGLPVKWLTQLAFSRSGFTGLADPLYNAILGVKYQRDLANMTVGPTNSYFLQALQRIATYFVMNSDTTNASERAAAKGMYELAVQPGLAYATGYLPAGPIMGYGLGAGYGYLSSPAFKSQWMDWWAGEADTKKSKTGEKNESGGW
jgi:hypothetical protein